MSHVTKLLRDIQDPDQYLQDIAGGNRQKVMDAADILISSEGTFSISRPDCRINTADITTKEEALSTIFGISQDSYTKLEHGDGMSSPIAVAMNILSATNEKPEFLN